MVMPYACTVSMDYSLTYLALFCIITNLPDLEFWLWRHPEHGYLEQYVQGIYWCPERKCMTKTRPCSFKKFATEIKFPTRLQSLCNAAEKLFNVNSYVAQDLRGIGQRVNPFPPVEFITREFSAGSAWEKHPEDLMKRFDKYISTLQAAYFKFKNP